MDIADYPAFQKLIIQEVGNAILDIPNNPAIGSETIRDRWPAVPYIVLFVAIFYDNDVSKRGLDDIALIDWRVILVMQACKLADGLFINGAMQAVIVNPNEAVVMQQVTVSPHSIVCAFAPEPYYTHILFLSVSHALLDRTFQYSSVFLALRRHRSNGHSGTAKNQLVKILRVFLCRIIDTLA